jgi:hypothetical protein
LQSRFDLIPIHFPNVGNAVGKAVRHHLHRDDRRRGGDDTDAKAK